MLDKEEKSEIFVSSEVTLDESVKECEIKLSDEDEEISIPEQIVNELPVPKTTTISHPLSLVADYGSNSDTG